MSQCLAQAEVIGLALIDRGHDIPCRASRRQMVECGEFARQTIRLRIRRRARGAETDARRHRRNRTQHRQRIHARRVLIAIGKAIAMIAAETCRYSQPTAKNSKSNLPRSSVWAMRL